MIMNDIKMKLVSQINTLLLAVLVIALALPSCSTQKSKEELSPLGKLYHNTTSEFNGYFNADVLLKENTIKLNEQQTDNYNQLLPIYEYMAADNPQAVSPDLDKAMEKVAVVVSLHRQSHWADDCYLLMGKAQFLKKDYETTEETLKYMIEEYPENPDLKKKRKKKKKVSKSDKKKKEKERRKEREAAKKKKQKEIEKKRKASKKKKKKRKKKKRRGKKKKSKPKKTEKEEPKKEEVEKTEEEKPKEEKKKKKADKNPNSPDKYILKHRPAFQEGQLWYARTLVERGKFDLANRIFNKIEQNPKTFKYIRKELAPAMAHSAIEQKKYGVAITHLETAIELAGNRQDKARYAFIVAQLQKKQKDNAAAYASFQRVVKFRPEYEMLFNAKLQMAQNAWATGQSTPDQINSKLNKMLSDGKNADYKDQIYFALGQIALQGGDRKSATENFQLAAKFSSGNKNQQAEIYYQLASLFLNMEDYVDAKLYYDSTLTMMSNDDPRYNDVVKFALNLADIATNIQQIEMQDSLLAITEMTPEEQKALATKIKQEEEKQRLKDAIAAAQGGSNTKPKKNKRGPTPFNRATPGIKNSTNAVPVFFAYDDKAKRRGQRAFSKKWGQRPNVDNWRLSSKLENINVDEDADPTDVAIATKDLTDDQIKQILGDVPSNPVEIAQANNVIEKSLFNLGKLYRDNLENNKKAVETLEELLKRFPQTKDKAEAWFYLYLAHKDLGNNAEAQVYYNKILKEAPESLFATVLKNPNYYKDNLAEEQKVDRYYEQAYAKFTSGNYKAAYEQSENADTQFGTDNPLRAKFALLKAMSSGSVEGKEAYIKALKEVIAQYPNTDEQRRAKEILRLLGDASAFSKIDDGADNESGTKSLFKYDEEDLHYVIVVLEGKADLGKAKSDVGNYHRKYFKNESMRVSNIYLGQTQEDRVPIIVVRRFKGAAKAMAYYNGIKKNEKDFLGINFKYKVYPITQNNYRQVLKERSLDGYSAFFEANYK